ncbi:thioesterase family protein [Catellatospora sp. NPDC049609]|uniref:acyl-CoA thioesterase n=1 Tax=Catellatospora sp. NPDC049609 TaxID=3155505 RepID=UPI0034136545
MADAVLTYRGVVYPWHCDHMGHMNVMWYVGKFDEATWNLFDTVGITPDYLRAASRGMAAVEQHITYQRELFAGDTVIVTSTLLEVRDKVLKLRHEMRNAAGQTAAVTVLTAVHLDTAHRRSCAMPPEILDAARELLPDD